ncbi:MAG: hypothetical protein EBZ77_14570 [Chitinophagia bacterium]|nr:hypothetical protein [Chitinophagia bacterium]
MQFRKYYPCCLLLISLAACNNTVRVSRGPIRLGDSATIVTETDPARLNDLVTDLKPVIPAARPDSPANTPAAADTSHKATVATAPAPTAAPLPQGNGLKIDFTETSIFVPGIAAKQFGKADLSKANGAVYALQGGQLPGNVLHVTGTITKVSQRYQVVCVLRGKGTYLPLDAIGATTAWQPMAGGNGSYPIKGLGPAELVAPQTSEAAIKSAIARSVRARRLNRRKQQEWMETLGRGVKAANQKPLEVVLRSVMWKIDGKKPDGKPFSKQVRIDLPL